ncbi:MAG: 6-pyruvoyl-tetrahydropterin synthase-related protein [Candidatus Promineifilaceae bacterium]
MSASSDVSPSVPVEHRRALPLLLLAALLVAFFAAWPLISEPGFLNTRGGGDSPFLLQRLQQMEVALRDGHFPVRWMPDANYGYGYPFFNYYAPLSIYVAVLFRFLGFSFIRSLELAQLSGFLLAAAGIFLLVRRWTGNEWAAFLASVAYTFAPFHMVNIYVRGDSLAEFWAMALYPWVILTADRLWEAREDGFPYGRAAALATAFAALVLSHNISALIFTPFLILFVFLRWFTWQPAPENDGPGPLSRTAARPLLAATAAGCLALALAAWFFVPALAEQNLAQLDPVTGGYFHYSNHFRGANLVQQTVIFDYDVAGGNAFRMGLVQAAATLFGAAALLYATFRGKVTAGVAAFILLTLVGATFMITPLSHALWDNLPLLAFTQFPWRFLSIQAFAASLAIGALALLPYCRVIAIGTAALLIAAGLAGLQTDELLLADADVGSTQLAAYEWFTGNIGSTVSAEYLPRTMNPRLYSSAWLNEGRAVEPRALRGQLLDALPEEPRTTERTWRIKIGESGATLMLPILAWPGWEARLDNEPVDMQAAAGAGLIMLEVPAGDHVVSVRLTRTPLRLAAELISLAALLVLIWLVWHARPAARIGRGLLLAALVVVVFLLLFRFWPEPAMSSTNLTWDFAQMAYLHHDEAGTPFNSGTTLLAYEYDKDVVAAGDELAITLHFSDGNGDRATIALGTPALVWPAFEPQAPDVATASKLIDQEVMVFTLPIPKNAPAGLVVPRLTLDVGRPLMPSGELRGDLFLRPLRIVNDHQLLDSGAGLGVQAADVVLRDSSTLDVRLSWQTATPLSENYIASLILMAESGSWLAQHDSQPGYGFLPSSEWPVGMAVDDWLALGLPEDIPRGLPLAMVARLYEAGSGDVVLTRRLGYVVLDQDAAVFTANEPDFTVPENITPLEAVFGDSVRLIGYDLAPQGPDMWRLTLYWQALEAMPDAPLRFVHVYDPETETIVYQIDGHARQNSYPADQWTPGEVISDQLTIDLSGAPSSTFSVGVGWYRPADGQRLGATNPENGETIASDRVPLPESLAVEQ